MHTTFTGTARKPRQVNLSGRNVANPWSALFGSAKSSPSASGSQNAVAQAQADRVRRQHERDKVNAARKIQKTWRGHANRKVQKQKWRDEWDAHESKRLQSSHGTSFEPEKILTYSDTPYATSTLCWEQLRLLVRFLDVKQETDTKRLLYFGNALKATFEQEAQAKLNQTIVALLQRLATIVSQQIQSKSLQPGLRQAKEDVLIQLLGLNTFITGVIPDDVAPDAETHFHTLQSLLESSPGGNILMGAIAGYTITMLSHTTTGRGQVLLALVHEIFTKPQAKSISPLLEFLEQPSQQEFFSEAAIRYILLDLKSRLPTRSQVDSELWLLSYLVYLRRETARFSEDNTGSFATWLHAVSMLLSGCANDIAARIDETDLPMNGTDSLELTPLHPFVHEQVLSLSQQNNIVQVMDQLRRAGGRDESVSSMAKPLANYAIALLRAFPKRAGNIRMWLYRGSPATSGHQSLSTIRYLWHASERTTVFAKIREQRNVMSVLTEAAPEHNHIGRAQVSPAEIAVWQEEWRIILLFMELYTFILKLMDDEEFFALDHRNWLQVDESMLSSFARGALPLEDVARLTTFLKNLAFPLYWHAADLDESNEAEETGSLSALFGTTPVESVRPVEKRKTQTLAGNGVSQAYLKGLVTGLLRMLHERDSRRKFLDDGHWLMTGQFEMQGFIPAVVAEEERRHEANDDLDDFDEYDIQTDPSEGSQFMETDAVVPSLTTMFGIRPPHTPRTQTSRFAEQQRKRRDVARRKRQLESLAPRLEILRNLPFFIPFETRVQIFREFIHRDQMRRRNGWIDADQWRMAIATSSQGRGLDSHGQPRAIDLVNRHRGEIRRDSVFHDAYDQFYDLGEELKEPIQISFIDQFGAAEAGIDGGGVTKEFLISVTSEAFDPNSDMRIFVENEQRYLYPNPNKFEAVAETLRRSGLSPSSESFKTQMRELLRQYEFLGRVVGKCLYEGILVDIVFAGFFLLKWSLTGGTTSANNETAYRASINDFRDFDESLYQGLLKLKNYAGDVESDFALNFTVTDEMELQGRNYTVTKDLIPNGSNTSVNNANRLLYIDKITRYRLQQQPSLVTNAFLKGLGQIIQPLWLAMFNQRELQKLVGGDSAELDIADLRRNTQYGGVYVIGDDGLEHPTVALFWKVLKEMSDTDRRKVLKFVTSTPRAPLLGFGHLNPKFSIRDSSEDQTRLPSTSTCVNLLKLPRYGDERTMREKLLYAVNSGAGFDLS